MYLWIKPIISLGSASGSCRSQNSCRGVSQRARPPPALAGPAVGNLSSLAARQQGIDGEGQHGGRLSFTPLQLRGYKKSVPVGLVSLPSLRCCAREPHLRIGFRARHQPCCRKRSDQLLQGAPGLPDAARHSLPPMVNAAGGHPRHSQRPVLIGGDGTVR